MDVWDGVRSDGGEVGEDVRHDVLIVRQGAGPLHNVFSRRVHLQMKRGHMNLSERERMRYARSRRPRYHNHISAAD